MIEVGCVIQKEGGESETFAREFEAVPRIGERVKMRGPEFGDESSSWREDGILVGESTFQVYGVDWDAHDGGAEIFLAPEPTETLTKLWCGCTKNKRLTYPCKPGEPECPNCGRDRR